MSSSVLGTESPLQSRAGKISAVFVEYTCSAGERINMKIRKQHTASGSKEKCYQGRKKRKEGEIGNAEAA